MKRSTRPRLRAAIGVVALAVAGVVSVTTSTAQAAPSRTTDLVPSAAQADPAALSGTLARRLGSSQTAGSYFDRASGKLVVTVTDDAAAGMVSDSGAVPRRVARSGAELARATAVLDRSARIPGTSWSIDPVTDQVVVTSSSTVKGADLARLTSVVTGLGASARLRHVTGEMSTLTTVMKNGTGINSAGGRCSLGFSVQPIGNTDPSEHYFLTAGHCGKIASTWYADSGLTTLLGSDAGWSFPGNDYGLVRYTGSGIRVLSQIEGRSNVITHSDDPYIGEGIARSGSTSGVRNGTVTGLNVTVTYASGGTVHGMVETNACAQPGDSGGPLYALDRALGLLSGGLGNCLAGGTQLTWYQPVTPVMNGFFMQIWP
jgi:streptogrisin D